MVTALMTTLPQNRLVLTHSFNAEITVFQSGKCAEATPSARTDPMSQPVMTVLLVFGREEKETGDSWCQASVTNTSTATMEIIETMGNMTQYPEWTRLTSTSTIRK